MQKLKEAKLIAQKLNSYREKGVKSALLTVVEVNGSAYKKEGAKFLVSEEGEVTCSISGGCLEEGLKEDALEVIRTSRPKLIKANLEDESSWGMWLGCPGEVTIYAEPVTYTGILSLWIDSVLKGLRTVWVKELFGDRELVVNEEGKEAGTHELSDLARDKLTQDRPTSELREGIFVDVVVPYPKIIVFGSGEEAHYIKLFGENLGFEVEAVSPKKKVNISKGSFVVIANHNLRADKVSLEMALSSGARYIGVISSRKRLSKILKEWDERIYNPAGLDLGKRSADEIAFSIVAEILTLYSGSSGKHLRDVKGGLVWK